MKNKDMVAMPLTGDVHSNDQGLTKFEECVFRAMHGLLSKHGLDCSPKDIADASMRQAIVVMNTLDEADSKLPELLPQPFAENSYNS